ncbi:MAG: CBS domain-containing protein [Anaerolineae bacterium]|nr:CBS domain-containing protein [Anaerolineae bacterium]
MTTELVTVSPDTAVTEAARLMRDADIGDVLVVDQGRLVGILTDRDVTVRVIAQGIDPKEAKVGDYMTRDLVTGMPEWDVEDAADLLGEEQIRRLPILEDGRLIGIVSLGDIAVQFAEEMAACQALEEISEPAMPRIGAVRK